jgi:hypothetical protein
VGGKVILPSLGKDFFTSVGKQFFTCKKVLDFCSFAKSLFPALGCQGSLVKLLCDADQVMRFR